jgi:hypothetical protein
MVHPVGACATAAVSMEVAFDKLRSGAARFVLAGGFDDLGPEGVVGFGDMNATARSEALAAVGVAPEEMSRASGLKHVELLVIKPSESIDKIAEHYMSELPWTIRVLLRLIGAAPRSGGSALISFLLSEKMYCRALIALGYRDAMQQREEIMNFLGVSTCQKGGGAQ